MKLQHFSYFVFLFLSITELNQLCLGLRDPSTPADIVQKEVFRSGEGGYYCFRIPALLFTSKGTLLAFAEGRGQNTKSCSDHGDVHIVVKRSGDEGETWSNLTVVHREYPSHTIGNPAPVEDSQSGKILLLFSRDNKQALQIESTDDGVTWNGMTDISEMVVSSKWSFVATGPAGGVQLPSGRLVVGVYAYKSTFYSGPGSFSIYSDDSGKTWHSSTPTPDDFTGECQVARIFSEQPQSIADKVLIMTSRTRKGHYFYYSNDSGESWYNSSFPSSLNPQTECQSSILTIPFRGAIADTHLYLTQPYDTSRKNMTYFHSIDAGQTWKSAFQLWSGPSAYSSMVYYKLRVFCLYERGKTNYWETLTLAILPPLI